MNNHTKGIISTVIYNILILFLIGLISGKHGNQKDDVTLYLIGDSTMSDKNVEAYPETGWGMPFRHYFDETVSVENHARNGRSTRTFLEEGLWDPVFNNLKDGDYVFIQFGHNDEIETKVQYTNPSDFQENLFKFIHDSRMKGAIPILLTPVARRHFDNDNQLIDTHEQYSALVREVADTYKVPMIDMDDRSQNLIRELGPEASMFLFNHLVPGQNPHYPAGISDNTHFNELGARRIAEMVLKGIEELDLELKERITTKN
jgi:lysophospholipase L1-like esterase